MITKGEFNTDPDTINTLKLIKLFKDYYMPKRNTYHSRGDFFWAKQEVWAMKHQKTTGENLYRWKETVPMALV